MFKTANDGTDSLWLPSSVIAATENVISVSAAEKSQTVPLEADYPNAMISKEDYKIATRVVECGIIPVLCVLGLPANIINMVVFYRQGLQDKMNLCLFALAFVDFMSVLCMFLYTLYCPAYFFLDAVSVQIFKWSTLQYTLNFRNAFLYSSGILTAIIATERCICVVWPLKTVTILKTKTMAWVNFCIILSLNIFCLPYALKHAVRLHTDVSGNTTVIFDDTDLYLDNKLVFQIIRDIILPGISFITFLVVSFVTVVTVRKLKTAIDWRQKTSSNVMDKRQVSLIKILIAVSCVYIVCNFPKLLLALLKFVISEFSTLGKYSNMFFLTHAVAFALLMINSSVNIFIYYRQSTRFRKELRACDCYLRGQVEENEND